MMVYHGTTRRRAERICEVGFLPRKPSKRVWFAESRKYAEGRARTQARRAHDRAAVLSCELDMQQLRRRLGPRNVLHRGRVIAVNGPVPVDVIRSHPATECPTSPDDLAQWVNRILRLKPWKGVGRTHPGIQRLSRWVTNHVTTHPKHRFPDAEVLALARQWLPEHFESTEVDLETLHAYRRPEQIDVACAVDAMEPDPREEKAVDLLASPKARDRRRGLRLLADLGEPDMADWCGMYLEDESTDVVVCALRLLRQCDDVNTEALAPLGDHADKRVRASAVATLARHGGGDGAVWLERGLKDPETCVRLEASTVLADLDPTRHRRLFQIALYDPNPDVARRARELARGKGFTKKMWPKQALRTPV